jgi:hypothetical protein
MDPLPKNPGQRPSRSVPFCFRAVVLNSRGRVLGLDPECRAALKMPRLRAGADFTAGVLRGVRGPLREELKAVMRGRGVGFRLERSNGKGAQVTLLPMRGANGKVVAAMVTPTRPGRSGRSPAAGSQGHLVSTFWEDAVLEAADREWQALRRRLHDGLSPHLLGAAFAARSIERALPKNSSLAGEVKELARLIQSAAGQAQQLAGEGDPAALSERPLQVVLRELVASEAGAGGRFEEAGVWPRRPAVDWQLYRAASELLGTRNPEVVVRLMAEEAPYSRLELAFGNFAPPSPKAVSLAPWPVMLRCRAARLSGSVAIHTSARGALTVVIHVPYWTKASSPRIHPL